MKKIFIALLLLLPALGFVGCSNDDEPNAPGDGSSSGYVNIDGKKFDIKYAYCYLYDDDDDEYDEWLDMVCSDTDLSDIYMGKPFSKTVSLIDVWCRDIRDENSEFYIGGGYKVYVDFPRFRLDEFMTKEKDSVAFEYHGNDHPDEENPAGSTMDYNFRQMPFTIEGKYLRAEAFTTDIYADEGEELGLRDFSISLRLLLKTLRTSQLKWRHEALK